MKGVVVPGTMLNRRKAISRGRESESQAVTMLSTIGSNGNRRRKGGARFDEQAFLDDPVPVDSDSDSDSLESFDDYYRAGNGEDSGAGSSRRGGITASGTWRSSSSSPVSVSIKDGHRRGRRRRRRQTPKRKRVCKADAVASAEREDDREENEEEEEEEKEEEDGRDEEGDLVEESTTASREEEDEEEEEDDDDDDDDDDTSLGPLGAGRNRAKGDDTGSNNRCADQDVDEDENAGVFPLPGYGFDGDNCRLCTLLPGSGGGDLFKEVTDKYYKFRSASRKRVLLQKFADAIRLRAAGGGASGGNEPQLAHLRTVSDAEVIRHIRDDHDDLRDELCDPKHTFRHILVTALMVQSNSLCQKVQKGRHRGKLVVSTSRFDQFLRGVQTYCKYFENGSAPPPPSG